MVAQAYRTGGSLEHRLFSSGVKTLDQLIDEEDLDVYGAIERRYLAIATDYSKEDYGQICTRISAFLEMIYDDKAREDRIDINYGYKLFFSHFKEMKSDREIFENLYEYTGILMTIMDYNGQELCGIGTENIENLRENEVRVELPDKKGYFAGWHRRKRTQRTTNRAM